MLEVQNLHTYYGDSHILHGVTLSVQKGSVSILLGRNGMGKTTTLHSIMGITPSKQGKILINGKEIQGEPNYKVSKSGIGIVPQGRRIFGNLTVKENLLTTHRPYKDGWNLNDIYDMFPRLKERESSMGGNLSGGEQQMLSIGRALMTNPKLLLLDEPSEGLSPLMVREVIKIIIHLKNEGLPMLIVEQNLAMATSLADHVYVLNKGNIVFDGPSEEFDTATRNKFLSLSS
ncbi:ABC transporter ATP-binding protein [Aquibacillus sp. 3ASR75-11]|uniref:ABC transporter ATP-binding protein n=1 Tax=Terrihalobacillus insolitus TaxID=2950438 RepID=A0A9X4AL73_9BACI|nr:ABC transporter ATP-binding protein [Terrihalobacillus insolitus]MDC3413983.1 ABC transporter ATP-binding protein [Terrihalobacillus insolitus]MDC3424072.1 ABC transporter ATP-binding protein [Terrihalobacillus insolitus]